MEADSLKSDPSELRAQDSKQVQIIYNIEQIKALRGGDALANGLLDEQQEGETIPEAGEAYQQIIESTEIGGYPLSEFIGIHSQEDYPEVSTKMISAVIDSAIADPNFSEALFTIDDGSGQFSFTIEIVKTGNIVTTTLTSAEGAALKVEYAQAIEDSISYAITTGENTPALDARLEQVLIHYFGALSTEDSLFTTSFRIVGSDITTLEVRFTGVEQLSMTHYLKRELIGTYITDIFIVNNAMHYSNGWEPAEVAEVELYGVYTAEGADYSQASWRQEPHFVPPQEEN